MFVGLEARPLTTVTVPLAGLKLQPKPVPGEPAMLGRVLESQIESVLVPEWMRGL